MPEPTGVGQSMTRILDAILSPSQPLLSTPHRKYRVSDRVSTRLAETTKWKMFHLVEGNWLLEINCQRCPLSKRCLENSPSLCRDLDLASCLVEQTKKNDFLWKNVPPLCLIITAPSFIKKKKEKRRVVNVTLPHVQSEIIKRKAKPMFWSGEWSEVQVFSECGRSSLWIGQTQRPKIAFLCALPGVEILQLHLWRHWWILCVEGPETPPPQKTFKSNF